MGNCDGVKDWVACDLSPILCILPYCTVVRHIDLTTMLQKSSILKIFLKICNRMGLNVMVLLQMLSLLCDNEITISDPFPVTPYQILDRDCPFRLSK